MSSFADALSLNRVQDPPQPPPPPYLGGRNHGSYEAQQPTYVSLQPMSTSQPQDRHMSEESTASTVKGKSTEEGGFWYNCAHTCCGCCYAKGPDDKPAQACCCWALGLVWLTYVWDCCLGCCAAVCIGCSNCNC
ncbi:hypothetical protein ABW19_dt0204873 [Dactylella cylindrospora]|nr:hypothetical protein ABW19_dt0204873 [Dactylella cylindrospora]